MTTELMLCKHQLTRRVQLRNIRQLLLQKTSLRHSTLAFIFRKTRFDPIRHTLESITKKGSGTDHGVASWRRGALVAGC